MTTGFVVEDRVAQNILDQIGVPTLMGLGAHKISRYLDAVTFQVKIAKPGQSRARVMTVKIELDGGTDLYNMSVGLMERRTLDWYSLVDVQGIDAEQMVYTLRRYA